jgi:hypothetical protein
MAKHRTGILDRIFGVIWPISVMAFAAVLCLEAAALVAVAPEVVREMSGTTDTLFVIVPYPTRVVDVGGDAPVYLFVFFAAAILASLAWLLRDWRKIGLGVHEALNDKVAIPEKSQIGLSFQLFCVMMLGSVGWYVLISLAGVQASTPAFDEMERWELAYVFAKASVYEELITRVLYIGVPMALIALYQKRAGWWKLFAGGKDKLEASDWAVVAVSGAIFALAHAPGWDLWKVPPTVISGVAFGYLFAKKGLAPAIVVHFAIDYMSMPVDVFGLSTLDYLLTLFLLGAVFLGVYYAARFAMEATESLGAPKASAGKSTPPGQASASLDGRFVCMACGNVEAMYLDGALKCTRCGQEYKFL